MPKQSTEQILAGVFPPEEETEGVDFMKILDDFDPAALTEEQLGHFTLKLPTGVWVKKGSRAKAPEFSAAERIGMAVSNARYARNDLEAALGRYQEGKTRYEIVRKALVKAVRAKVIRYRLMQEFDAMSPGEQQRVRAQAQAGPPWMHF